MSGHEGKKNAITHGLFAKRLSRDEKASLAAVAVEDVEGEIAMERALIARLLTILENNVLGPGDKDSLAEETRHTVKLVNEAMARLQGLLRLHSQEARRLKDPAREFEEGKHMARVHRNVYGYLDAETEPKKKRKGR
jgi:hypothetical protein